MKVAIANDKDSFELKRFLIPHLESWGFEVIDKTSHMDSDLYEAATDVCHSILNKEADRGIILDQYGVGSSIAANKHKGIICANVFDEHSARMTVEHNNSSIITIGSGIVGDILAKQITGTFLKSEYEGGRHQIRVDMLNKMC